LTTIKSAQRAVAPLRLIGPAAGFFWSGNRNKKNGRREPPILRNISRLR
jgi:hypothetical protein